jgi:hypothetical protein
MAPCAQRLQGPTTALVPLIGDLDAHLVRVQGLPELSNSFNAVAQLIPFFVAHRLDDRAEVPLFGEIARDAVQAPQDRPTVARMRSL